MDLTVRIDPPQPPPFAGPDLPRLALVHDWLTGMRGGEKCLEPLCDAFPEATLHTLLHKVGSTSPAIERMAIQTSALQKVPGIERHYRKLLPLMPWAARGWRVAKDAEVVLSLSHCVAKSIRLPRGVPHLCYCFTPMRYAWDGRDAYLDSWTDRPFRRALAARMLDRFREWDRKTAANVTQFIAISQTVAERIRRNYGRESVVIPPPVDVAYHTPTGQPRGNAYLVASALVPYKRVDHAVIACTKARRELIVIGTGPERERLERLAGPTVKFLGWQPDEVLREHYRTCRALLFPGDEDFGIVPIEALGCEAPVIALNRGGAAETVDGQVGAVYDEESAEALGAALDRWEAAGRPHDPRLARRRAEGFAAPLYRERMLNLIRTTWKESPGAGFPQPTRPATIAVNIRPHPPQPGVGRAASIREGRQHVDG